MAAYLNGFDAIDLDAAVLRAAPALARLNGGRLLLTGATGFFGQWLMAVLVHANATGRLKLEIAALTRSPAAFTDRCPDLAAAPGVQLLAGDVRSFTDLPGACSHVIHAATDTSRAAAARPLELIDTIIGGTRRVIDVAVQAGARDLLYVSSGAVYGRQGSVAAVREDEHLACDPLDPQSAYGEAKRLAETMCILATQNGIAPKIARCFAFVGPGLPLDTHFAIGNFISDAIKARTIRVAGDGTPLRTYLYAADLAVWLLMILTHGPSGRAYNVGGAQPMSIKQLAEAVASAVPEANGVEIAEQAAPGEARSRYVPSVQRAEQELGVQPWTTLGEAINKTAAWARRGGGKA